MKKKFIPIIVLASTSSVAMAENTIELGLNYSDLSENVPTSIGGGFEDDLPGYFINLDVDIIELETLRLGVKIEHETKADSDLTVRQSSISVKGTKEFFNYSIYGLIGVENFDADWDISSINLDGFSISNLSKTSTVGTNDNAPIAEVGVEFHPVSHLKITPSIRVAAYEETSMKYKLSGEWSVTDNFGVVAKVAYQNIDFVLDNFDLDETQYQLGVTYKF